MWKNLHITILINKGFYRRKNIGITFEKLQCINEKVMATDSNLQFIREKIYKVRSAIMYSMSDEVIKFPNSIVTAVRVDDEGQLWFLCKKPMIWVNECEQHFPARLKFYRKGVSFFVEVSGKATIVKNN